MITVLTDNYFAMIRAAQAQALRSGAPLDNKQSVPVAVTQSPVAPVPQNAAEAISKIVNVLI